MADTELVQLMTDLQRALQAARNSYDEAMAFVREAKFWLVMKLLRIAWRVLPREHPAYRGIFDAACAIRDPVLSENTAPLSPSTGGHKSPGTGGCVTPCDEAKPQPRCMQCPETGQQCSQRCRIGRCTKRAARPGDKHD